MISVIAFRTPPSKIFNYIKLHNAKQFSVVAPILHNNNSLRLLKIETAHTPCQEYPHSMVSCHTYQYCRWIHTDNTAVACSQDIDHPHWNQDHYYNKCQPNTEIVWKHLRCIAIIETIVCQRLRLIAIHSIDRIKRTLQRIKLNHNATPTHPYDIIAW